MRSHGIGERGERLPTGDDIEIDGPETHCALCSEELEELDGVCSDPVCIIYEAMEDAAKRLHSHENHRDSGAAHRLEHAMEKLVEVGDRVIAMERALEKIASRGPAFNATETARKALESP